MGSYWCSMTAFLSSSSLVDISEFVLYVLYWAKINKIRYFFYYHIYIAKKWHSEHNLHCPPTIKVFKQPRIIHMYTHSSKKKRFVWLFFCYLQSLFLLSKINAYKSRHINILISAWILMEHQSLSYTASESKGYWCQQLLPGCQCWKWIHILCHGPATSEVRRSYKSSRRHRRGLADTTCVCVCEKKTKFITCTNYAKIMNYVIMYI